MYPYFVVNGFTNHQFGGNPAGVIVLEHVNYSLQYLKNIVLATKLPEISFIAPVEGANRYHIRWITPKTELHICGHGSIGAAHIIYTYLNSNIRTIYLESNQKHKLIVHHNRGWYRMSFPTLTVEACDTNISLIESAINTSITALYKGHSYLALLSNAKEVEQLDPNIPLISDLNLPGLIVAAPGIKQDFVCRYFAPKKGIDEDSATGTAHVSVAQLLFSQNKKRHFVSKQLSERGGDFLIDIEENNQCWLSGQAYTFISGKIHISS